MGAPSFDRALLTAFTLAAAVALAAYLLIPRLPRKPIQIVLALTAICVFLWGFILHFGRWQFGGYDFSVLTDTGYRQLLGQRPYLDFPTTTPPGFSLGILYAFRLFGLNWDANLYATAIFACVTFLWLYWLFRKLDLSPRAAFLSAFAIQSVANLTLCFWWYNNITLVLAAVVFLSALAYIKQRPNIAVQSSYVLSLAFLSLTKPNIAGIALLAAILLALSATHRIRTIVLTLAAAGLSVLILELNHISIADLLASYKAVASERGLGATGLQQRDTVEKLAALFWITALSLPILALRKKLRIQLTQGDWRSLTATLYFFAAPLIAIYGVLTNGEFYEVECTVLIAASSILIFTHPTSPTQRRIYAALLCGFIASSLYLGAERIRINSVGIHRFFEWQDNRIPIPTGYLKNMRVSSTLIDAEHQITQALQANPGPYFFGPSLEFNYAANHLPSPTHLPVWWQPGTAFGRTETTHMIEIWRAHNFQTLIYLKDDYSYYTPELGRAILDHYTRDDRYPALTVYHLHP